ncbi:hypothetical protein K438DRAFT_2027500 [Mycena galopus ATCC 62051]|nr:hypothetical protein K438DRAFT_2027500 [Mycena galopus ATCC 62051]
MQLIKFTFSVLSLAILHRSTSAASLKATRQQTECATEGELCGYFDDGNPVVYELCCTEDGFFCKQDQVDFDFFYCEYF